MADGVLVVDGRVLMARRASDRAEYPGLWDIVGGHVEPNESSRCALRRELRKELGIKDTLGQPWRRLTDEDLELMVWVVDRWDGNISNCAHDEHEEPRWFSGDEIKGLPTVDRRVSELVSDVLRARLATRWN